MMSTTILHRPEMFDERVVNRILHKQEFEEGELHEDQLADLWGFVKYFYDGTGDIRSLKLSKKGLEVFEELCHSVEVDKLRYSIGDYSKQSPNSLAKRVYRDDTTLSESGETESGKKVNVNLDRIENQSEEPIKPTYQVNTNDEELKIVVQDDSVEVTDSGVEGTDRYGNKYVIRNSEISDNVENLTERDFEKSTNNGLTTLTVELE